MNNLKFTLAVKNFQDQDYQLLFLLLLFQRQIIVDYYYSSLDRLRQVVLFIKNNNSEINLFIFS